MIEYPTGDKALYIFQLSPVRKWCSLFQKMASEGVSIYKYEKETFQYAALISTSRLANSNPYPVLLRRTAVTQ